MTSIPFVDLRNRWWTHVPAAVACSTWPRLLTQGGTLVIECAGPWTQELERRVPEILARLPLVDGNRVERLAFRYVPPVEDAKRDGAQPFVRPRRGSKRKAKR